VRYVYKEVKILRKETGSGNGILTTILSYDEKLAYRLSVISILTGI
jgi:hypothetical protein